MSRYFLRSKGSDSLDILPSFVLNMPHTGTPSNSNQEDTSSPPSIRQELLQQKEEEIIALRARIEQERTRQVDQEDEMQGLRERIRNMEREQQVQQDVHVQPLTTPPPMSYNTPPSNSPDRLSVRLEKFDGKTSAVQWWVKFMALVNLQGLTEQKAILYLPFFFLGTAETWFNALDTTVKSSLTAIHTAFINRFKPVSYHAFDLLKFIQGENESVEEFIQRVSEKATDLKVDSQKLMGRLMGGFKQNIRKDLIRHNPTTMEDLRTQALLAELAQSLEPDTNAIQSATNASLCTAVNSLEDRIQNMETTNMNMVNMVNSQSFHNNRPRPNQRQYRQNPRYQQPQPPQYQAQFPPTQYQPMTQYHQPAPFQAMQSNQPQHPAQYQQMPRPIPNGQQQTRQSSGKCQRCGESCDSFYNCRARNQICLNCNRPNHLWMCCRRLTNDLKTGKVTQTDIQNWLKQTNSA